MSRFSLPVLLLHFAALVSRSSHAEGIALPVILQPVPPACPAGFYDSSTSPYFAGRCAYDAPTVDGAFFDANGTTCLNGGTMTSPTYEIKCNVKVSVTVRARFVGDGPFHCGHTIFTLCEPQSKETEGAYTAMLSGAGRCPGAADVSAKCVDSAKTLWPGPNDGWLPTLPEASPAIGRCCARNWTVGFCEASGASDRDGCVLTNRGTCPENSEPYVWQAEEEINGDPYSVCKCRCQSFAPRNPSLTNP